MPVEAAHEVPAVLVPERDRYVLRGHRKDIDHVPASEVASGEIQAPLPAGSGAYGLPVIRPRAWRPMIPTQRNETEVALPRQPLKRRAGMCSQRRLAALAVLRGVELSRRRIELLRDDDPAAGEVDPLPPQRIQLTRPQARERGDV